MILIDLSHLAISNILSDYKSFKGEIDENLFKHMILVSLSNYKQKFQDEYGELVICCDSRKKKSWRKEAFPHYKDNRKKDTSFIDWPAVYKIVDSMIEDLRIYFPYKVIEVAGAEGDDCIACLAKHSDVLKEKSVVVSNDKDFNQLLVYNYVDIFSSKTKTFIKHSDPKQFLLEHIIKGDSSDGIPNILSIEETFVTGRRQASVTKKIMNEMWIPVLLKGETPDDWSDEVKTRFDKNKKLIDFNEIPTYIYTSIIDQYVNYNMLGDKQKVMRYFMENRMRNLLRDIAKF